MRVMARTIAGILKCVPHLLRQLRLSLNRVQAAADHGGTAMDRLKSVVCNAMVNLLQNWCPLVLYFAFLVSNAPGPDDTQHPPSTPIMFCDWCSCC